MQLLASWVYTLDQRHPKMYDAGMTPVTGDRYDRIPLAGVSHLTRRGVRVLPSLLGGGSYFIMGYAMLTFPDGNGLFTLT